MDHDSATDDAARERATERALTRLGRLPRVLVAAMLFATVAGHRALDSYKIAGRSMMPAYEDGDRIVVASLPGFVGEPRCGEAVVARVGDEVVIKRVAGLPGDVIEVRDGQLLRNGVAAADPIPARFHDHSAFGPLALSSAQYFLLGDHRSVSIDSREFGPVERSELLGRVILRVAAEPTAPSAVARERP